MISSRYSLLSSTLLMLGLLGATCVQAAHQSCRYFDTTGLQGVREVEQEDLELLDHYLHKIAASMETDQ